MDGRVLAVDATDLFDPPTDDAYCAGAPWSTPVVCLTPTCRRRTGAAPCRQSPEPCQPRLR